MPPYKSSLMAITSVHECPVTKMQMKFSTSRLSREKKKPAKIRTSNAGDQQRRSKNSRLNYSKISRNNRYIRHFLEDEVALAKDIFWAEKKRIYKEATKKAIKMGKKKRDKFFPKLKTGPRWYQDFSPNQMRNLMTLENVMRTDYEETKATGTQTTLIAIGVISTFFKLKPSTIKELHKASNLNSVDFLREIYRILTGSDFCEEGYKKVYDCNERIILSAIAFLTLPETVKELHRRLPAITMPRLPPKPELITCLARRKSSCPYKEELFTRPDWAGYRNALRKWRKQCKLTAIPKIILPLNKYGQFFINDRSEIKKRKKDISTEHLEEISMKKLQKVSSTTYDQKDSSREQSVETVKSATFNIFRSPDDGKKFSSTTRNLREKPGTTEYKIYGPPKPPGVGQKSWLGKKDAHYMIAGVSKGSHDYPVTYEITGVANVTPSNSDEKFFAVLKLDQFKKVFPIGRENLSINWQEWLQNADEDYRQLEEEADKLVKNVQATIKSAFLGPVCDSCCSCRQTRKFDEKLQQSEIGETLINAEQNGEKNTHFADSMAMQSSGQSATGSPVNEEDEIKTNIIISGVTKQAGQTQYYISGIQKDKIPRTPEPPIPQPVRNVPPCSCAIQQMTDKDINLSASKDDIPWTKEEGLCPGKKYRPDELGAYSCKTYPGDKFCRYIPFTKEITRMERRKIEKRGEEEEEEVKEKTAFIEAKEKTQVLRKDVTERKNDKFIPDPDYSAYDDPWNISRTAPKAKITKTDYETTLKLTLPAWPTSLPLKTQERQNDFSSSKELQKIKNITQDKKNNKKTYKIFSKSSKKIKKEMKDMKKNKPTSLKKIAINKRGTKLSSKVSDLMTILKMGKKQQTKSSLPNNPTKQSNKINKLTKHSLRKKKKNIINEAEEIDNRKREMAKLKNMFKSFAGILENIQPAILPGELSAINQRNPEEKIEEIVDSSAADDEEPNQRIKKEPCGWRTKSEQELPAKKTLAYLCEPDYPLETMAVRPGGRPCQCRENRNKKKILMYNVSGLMERKIGGRKARRMRLEEENRIIDGVLYVTPPVSPRRSDEYVPEYDLLESPYDMCVSEATDKTLKLIEKYSGPKSLVEKIRRKSKLCNCNNAVTKKDLINQQRNLEETREKLMESKSPEERWKIALKDTTLMDYFTQRDNNAPCWTSCKKIARSARPRRLKVVKPVCECKHERKIIEQNEEKTEWKARQQRLKALKKQSFMHIADLSRPMIENKKFIISDVKRIPREDKKDDIKYCISGVAEDVSMSSPQKIVDGLKMSTPFQTPVSSEKDILRIAAPHRHWSPTNIPPGPLPRKEDILKEEMERRKRARDEAFKLIYGDKNEQTASYSTTRDDPEVFDDQKLIKKIEKKKDDTKESHTNVKKETSKAIMKLKSLSKKNSSKIVYHKDASRKEITGKVVREENKYSEGAVGEVGHQQNVPYRQVIDKTAEQIDHGNHRINGGGDKKYINNKSDLITIMKVELKKMAAEGYAFAKLPKCYLMPQLQDWLMYREGVVFSETDKKNLMQATRTTWELINLQKMEIEKPSLHMTKHQLKRLTYDQVDRIRKKIEKIRETYHSEVRKSRVSYARMMWSTMEHGKFPSASFKRTFFTYMASKEADGHVYKPWLPSEARERDFNFCCY
ncbi:uncharacterized protein LOC143904119 isoform X2 [Temnothorax americanus]